MKLYESNTGFIFLGTSLAGTLISITSLCYIYFKLKLNPMIKSILYFMGFQNLVMFLINVICILIILINKNQSFEVCATLLPSLIVVYSCDLMIVSLISAIRHHMVLKAAETRIANKSDVMKYFAFNVIAHYAFMIAAFSLHNFNKVISVFHSCSDDNYKPQGTPFCDV